MWCKLCQQSISQEGPEHSCDGMAELDHLMKQRGWKYCPSKPRICCRFHVATVLLNFFADCKTPIEKGTGCNHMTASAYSISMVVHLIWQCNSISVYRQDATLISATNVETLSLNLPFQMISMLQLVLISAAAICSKMSRKMKMMTQKTRMMTSNDIYCPTYVDCYRDSPRCI